MIHQEPGETMSIINPMRTSQGRQSDDVWEICAAVR